MELYETNSNGTIVEPGKFEGEPLYVPYFWNAALEGFSDEDYVDEFGTLISTFRIADEERRRFPALDKASSLQLWEDSQGFVYHCLR